MILLLKKWRVSPWQRAKDSNNRILRIGILGALGLVMLVETLRSDCTSSGDMWTNPKDGSAMVWIPGGVFMMGNDTGMVDERPRHSVSVEGFWLSKYEVTNAQYSLFLKETRGSEPDFWSDPAFNAPNQPVVGVRWRDAVRYCEWADVRLPTESEWEYAAACGTRQLHYGTSTGELNHDLANFAGVQGWDRWRYTSPVGSFPANPFGLFDLAGNAWEWCSSIWEPYPYQFNDGREYQDDSFRGLRTLRGGSWHYGPDYCAVSKRHYHREDLRFDFSGFRVALTDTMKLQR